MTNDSQPEGAIDAVVAAVAARLREEVVTRRLVVRDRGGGASVTVTAVGSTAELTVATHRPGAAQAAVAVAIVASLDDGDAIASAALVRDGDALGEWLVTAPATADRDGDGHACKLVFDDARGSRWLVLDRDGLREEPPIQDDS